MTSEEFSSKYRLLKAMGDGPDRRYTAEHRSSGQMVLVHFIDRDSADLGSELSGLVERLAPPDRAKVLETLTVDRSLVFVTQFIQVGRGFEHWLRAAAGAAPASPPPAQQPGLGEFTAMFHAGEEAPSENQLAPPKPTAAPSFTDLFRSATPDHQTTDPKPAAHRPPPAPPPVRVVGVRVPTPPKPVAAKPPELAIPKPHLGEVRAGPVAPPPVEAPVPRKAALFTPEPPAPPPPRAGSWSGPSDYTRELDPGARFSEPVPVVPPAADNPEAPDKRKGSYLPLLLVLNLCFIIATGLVVYFALRSC